MRRELKTKKYISLSIAVCNKFEANVWNVAKKKCASHAFPSAGLEQINSTCVQSVVSSGVDAIGNNLPLNGAEEVEVPNR